MNVLLELNHPYRDLAGLCELSKLFIQKNIYSKVYIVPREQFNDFIFSGIKLDIAVFGDPRSKWITYLKKCGTYIIVHESEGIYYYPELTFHSVSKRNQLSTDEIWSWGEEQKRIMSQNKKLKYLRDKIYVTGSVRYEYYKRLKKSLKPRVLQLNTNFPVISPKYRSFNEEMDQYFSALTKVRPDFLNDLIKMSIRRERIIHYFSDLIKDKAFKFVLRTHPFESTKYYLSHPLLKEINLTINDDSDIHDDLTDCFACINIGCQTTLDCIIRGVIPISAEPYGNLWDEVALKPNEFGSIEDLYLNLEKYNKLIRNKISESNLNKYLLNISTDLNLEKKIDQTLERLNNLSTKKFFNLYELNKALIFIKFTSKEYIKTVLKIFSIRTKKYLNKSKINNKKKIISFLTKFCSENKLIWTNTILDIFIIQNK